MNITKTSIFLALGAVAFLVVSACGGDSKSDADTKAGETAEDTPGECLPTCVETYARLFDEEKECVTSNDADIYVGCLPLEDPCEDPGYSEERRCYVSSERNTIVIWTVDVVYAEVLAHLTGTLGWQPCEDVFDEVPQQYESMFPVC